MDRIREFELKCSECNKGIWYESETGILDNVTEGEPRFPDEVNCECPFCERKFSITKYRVRLVKYGRENLDPEEGKIRFDEDEVWIEDEEGNKFRDDGTQIQEV